MYTKKYKKSLKYRKATFKSETKRLICWTIGYLEKIIKLYSLPH